MATGDVNDIVGRMVAVLPPWFPTPIANSPILRGVLTGIASPLAYVYSLYAFAKAQSRIKTMSGAFLDLASWDFLGPTFARRTAETDSSFQARLLAFLLLPKNTVAGITAMLQALTGNTPALLEPAIGTGGWDQTPAFAFDDTGCWSGSALAITAFRPPGQGIPNVDGFDGGYAGFDVGAIEWSDISQTTGAVTDAEITMRVRQWVAAGVQYSLNITNVPQDAPAWVIRANGILPAVDINFAANTAWVKGVGVVSIPSILNVVRSTPETVTDASGNVTYAVPNAPAYSSAGLQSWETRTNIALQSGDLSASPWFNGTSGSGTVSVTGNSGIAPDGTMSAALITCQRTSSSDAAYRDQTITVANSTTYTGSIWIKAASPADVGKLVYFDGFAGSTVFIQTITLTANWQRVPGTGATASTSLGFAVGLINGFGSQLGTVNFYAWGAQLEKEAAASPYIPTTTVAVTRAGDFISLKTLLNFGTSVTLLATGTNYQLSSTLSPFPCLLTVSDDTFNNRFTIFTDSGGQRDYDVVVGGVARVNSAAGGTIVPGTPTTWAMSVSPTAVFSAFDGNPGTSFGPGSVPTGLNTIEIGGVLPATNNDLWNGNVLRITIWPINALDESTLQVIT